MRRRGPAGALNLDFKELPTAQIDAGFGGLFPTFHEKIASPAWRVADRAAGHGTGRGFAKTAGRTYTGSMLASVAGWSPGQGQSAATR